MKRITAYILMLLLLTIFACKNRNEETRLVIYTRAPLKSILKVQQIGYFDEKNKVIDSAIIIDNHDSLVFYIPKKEERLLRISLNENIYLLITVINDSKLIRIHADYFADTCNIQGSPATTSLLNFDKSQDKLTKERRKYARQLDSLTKAGKKEELTDSLSALFDKNDAFFYSRYKGYADTVKSPAAFMRVFSAIDFGTDYKSQKKFILSNAKRFPGNKAIQELKKSTLALVRIYEEELKIGDEVPTISLPGKDGKPYSTTALKGQYYLIDLWATYCSECYTFKTAETKFFKEKPQSGLKIVSVALDYDADNWKNAIAKFNFPAVQLIDKKMWQGPAATALVFDSIPYNFLVNPKGKIIAKAIKPDSLLKVMARLGVK